MLKPRTKLGVETLARLTCSSRRFLLIQLGKEKLAYGEWPLIVVRHISLCKEVHGYLLREYSQEFVIHSVMRQKTS